MKLDVRIVGSDELPIYDIVVPRRVVYDDDKRSAHIYLFEDELDQLMSKLETLLDEQIGRMINDLA